MPGQSLSNRIAGPSPEPPVAARPVIPWPLGYSIVLIFVIVCGHYVYNNSEDFTFLASISRPELIAAGALILLTMLISAYQLDLFFRHFDLTLGKTELVALTFGLSLGNSFLPMRGGSAGLAVYMRRVHGLNFSSFAAIYGGTGLLAILVNSGLALLGFIYLAVVKGYFNPVPLVIIGSMFLVCLVFSLTPPIVNWKGRGVLGFIFSAMNSWRALTRNRLLLVKLTISFMGISFGLAAAFFFLYKAIGEPIGIWASMITSSLGNIANTVPISPGSLGVFDAVTIQIPQLFGIGAAESISATLIFRALWFIWGIGLGLPGLLYMARKPSGIKGND
jgi:uncharacterized membrane protein YbhN (UPF0104 family)